MAATIFYAAVCWIGVGLTEGCGGEADVAQANLHPGQHQPPLFGFLWQLIPWWSFKLLLQRSSEALAQISLHQ